MSNDEREADKDYHEELLKMDEFIIAFRAAERNGVTPEWLHSFFQAYSVGDKISEAISFANKEWDLG